MESYVCSTNRWTPWKTHVCLRNKWTLLENPCLFEEQMDPPGKLYKDCSWKKKNRYFRKLSPWLLLHITGKRQTVVNKYTLFYIRTRTRGTNFVIKQEHFGTQVMYVIISACQTEIFS